MGDFLEEFVKSRDKAFINFVETDNLTECRKHFKKYGQIMPRRERIAKAGIYKAVQYCTNIPEEIKVKAMVKCLELGFSPFVKPIERTENDE